MLGMLAGSPGQAAAPTPTPKAIPKPKATPRSAPADEYFGRMKLSFLGINNTFKDQAIRAGAYTINESVINALRNADDALHDWERKYPTDPQLARSYFIAIAAYSKIYTKEFQDMALSYMQHVITKFPNTFFAKQEKKNLAIGFTQHYYAPAQPCPTLPPPTETPAPGKHATPAPSPTPTPTPTPTTTPAPGQPKIVLLFQACVPQTLLTTPEPTGTVTPASSSAPRK